MENTSDNLPPVLSELITRHAAKTPDRNAINDGANKYSFGELHNMSDNLAHLFITKYGVRKGDRILIIAEKACEVVINTIATWKAGAIYVPVDRNNGPNRTQFIIQNVTPAVIVSTRELLEKFAEVIGDIPTISYEEIREIDKTTSLYTTRVEVTGEDSAIILHTSGSTGNPKGVDLQHKSTVAYFKAQNVYQQFDETKKSISYGPYHFDVTVQDTFLPLYYGAPVYIYNGLIISTIVINLMVAEDVTNITAISSVLSLITGKKNEIEKLKGTRLQVVKTGGELCDTKLINKWLETMPHLRVYNGYGPTECNCLCMCYQMEKPDYERTTPFPIGKAYPKMKAAIIDSNGQEIKETGVVGTLCIAGPQLMRGYWNLPDHTAKAFHYIDGERYYITGDLAQLGEDGNFSFEGRNDSEVKIKGRRINLNEIRNCVLKLDETEYAVAGTITEASGTYIYIYIYQSKDKALLTKDRVISFMRQTLPEYMMPKYVVISTEIYKTASNKVNEQEIRKNVEQQILAAAV